MLEKLAMGDYGLYVWTCYGVVALVVFVNEWRARVHHRKTYRNVEVLVKAREDR